MAPLHNDGILMSDAKGKANTLNQNYVSIFRKEEGDNPSKGLSPHSVMENLNIVQAAVTKLLKRLNMNKASAPDKTSPKMLKQVSRKCCSLETGRIPHEWEITLVAPIFKKGDWKIAANYRSVSLMSICCKVCKHVWNHATPGRPWLVINGLPPWLQGKVLLRNTIADTSWWVIAGSDKGEAVQPSNHGLQAKLLMWSHTSVSLKSSSTMP